MPPKTFGFVVGSLKSGLESQAITLIARIVRAEIWGAAPRILTDLSRLIDRFATKLDADEATYGQMLFSSNSSEMKIA